MSGPECEGLCERADILAYLDRKAANAATMLRADVGFEDDAHAVLRTLTFLRSDIVAGLHEGEAAMAEGGAA